MADSIKTGLIQRLGESLKAPLTACCMYAWLHFHLHQLLKCYMLAVFAVGIYAPEIVHIPNPAMGFSGGKAW
jgi:hypothetical protein